VRLTKDKDTNENKGFAFVALLWRCHFGEPGRLLLPPQFVTDHPLAVTRVSPWSLRLSLQGCVAVVEFVGIREGFHEQEVVIFLRAGDKLGEWGVFR